MKALKVKGEFGQRRPMGAQDRSLWEDAEGSLTVPERVARGVPVSLRTSQLELDILLDYQFGAASDGVKCKIFTRHARKSARTPRAYTFYETSIVGLANIALELALTAPYRRSKKLYDRTQKFKKFLALPRKKTQRSVIEARALSRAF